MCGLTGILNAKTDAGFTKSILEGMTTALAHRGPDEACVNLFDRVGLGFRRLSIIDLAGGSQPFFNPDNSIVMLCNGEIFNHKALRQEMESVGYSFRSQCDVEVILPLYEHYGLDFIKRLNGQFAIVIYDSKKRVLLLIRDHFGICPLFFVKQDDQVIFASEIKALLKHPHIPRKINMRGLDQVFTFPGTLSPETLFDGVVSVKPGHFVLFSDDAVSEKCYWDIIYPTREEINPNRNEDDLVEELDSLLTDSVRLRVQADVPVGFYLSGGLDSSLIGSLSKIVNNGHSFPAFSILFPGQTNTDINEHSYQRLMSKHLECVNHEIPFDWSDIERNLRNAVWYSETALKETYNTCSLALSSCVAKNGIKVVLSGEGADEIFGGYPGYRFDYHRQGHPETYDQDVFLEKQVNKKLWSNSDFFYEHNLLEVTDIKKALYSNHVNSAFNTFNCLSHLAIDVEKLRNRHSFHIRSYLDFKLRLGDHLIADHCDRVCYANSIEGRYPFLDQRIIHFASQIPPDLMMKNLVEKYLLKKMATRYLPAVITDRQKFGFVAPGSPHLVQQKIEWVEDMLSPEKISRQGYFNPATIERIKNIYQKPGFRLNLPFEQDLLIVVLTFNVLLDLFDLPNY